MSQKRALEISQNAQLVFPLACFFFFKITVKHYANQRIGMISEGSCDTEDWCNDAENSALHHKIKLHFNIYYIENSFKFQIIIIFNNITVFFIK